MKNLLRKAFFTTLFCSMLISLVGCGTIISISDFIVELTTKTGNVIKQKAKTLSSALENAWQYVFAETDPNDPSIIIEKGGLSAVHHTTILVKIVIPGGNSNSGAEISVKLINPRLIRKNPTSKWEIDPDNYPPEIRDQLQKRNA